MWTRVATSRIFFPVAKEIDRQICRETYSSGIPTSFVLCNFRANINTLCSAASSRSTLNSAPCIGLYVLRKQTNQYQSLKFPWLHGMFHFKWDERLSCLRLKGKRENYHMIPKSKRSCVARVKFFPPFDSGFFRSILSYPFLSPASNQCIFRDNFQKCVWNWELF